MPPPELDTTARYHRQMLLPGFGDEGQKRLGAAHVLVVGCGALGSVAVDCLARAGVGTLTIVDRDVVELTNLQRQVLFDERDVREGLPKAVAAAVKVGRINGQVQVRGHVDDFNARNAQRYVEGVDVIVDGLDNFETRYLLNDLAVKHGRAYVYGGAVGTTGVSLTILPAPDRRDDAPGSTPRVTWAAEEATPCLRCVFPEAPPPGTSPTCDTAGVLGPVVSLVAAHQAAQTLKLITGHLEAVDRSLLSIDVWSNQVRRFDVAAARTNADCPCCVRGDFEYLEGRTGSRATALCGRNAVQITPQDASCGHLDMAETARRLAPHGVFTHNEHLLRGSLASPAEGGDDAFELTLFPNGRAIIKGTTDPEVARSIYARYVGA